MTLVFRAPCPAPRAVSGATLTWTMTSHGDVAEYVCLPGHRFVDRQRTTSAVCVDGVWSTAVPDCIRLYKLAFHDADTDILARIVACRRSACRRNNFSKSHVSDVSARILARMSVSVSAFQLYQTLYSLQRRMLRLKGQCCLTLNLSEAKIKFSLHST